jgi:hypothetical protein
MGSASKETTETKIPENEKRAAIESYNRAKASADLGNMGYYGPDVAAMTPQQIAGQQNTLDMASAFGMNVPQGGAMSGMPQAQTFAGGVQGYSSGDLYDESLRAFQERSPEQAAAYQNIYPNAFPSQQSGSMSDVEQSGYPYGMPSAPPADIAKGILRSLEQGRNKKQGQSASTQDGILGRFGSKFPAIKRSGY